MGRTRRNGLDYFPFDVDFFNDIKVRKLIKYQSGKAVTVYALLLCIIYREGYYIEWDKELPFIISEQTGFDEAYVKAVIECCLNLGLLNAGLYQRHHVLSSRGIQKRYQQVCQVGRRIKSIDDYSLLSTADAPRPAQPEQLTLAPEPEARPDAREQKFRDDMKASPLWVEQMCMRHAVDRDKLMTIIDDFFLDCQCRDKTHDSTQDAKRHFNDWLLTRAKKNPKKPNKKNVNDLWKP